MKSGFSRKLVYMVAVLVLFVAMIPVRSQIDQIRADPSLRLSEATLGGVDPTSSAMVLVLGGLRGIAVNLLWQNAIDLQREHDWTNLEPVVASITELQPHFIYVWTFQGWNLAYNVSVEWDQVDDKYYWIKRGIKFVDKGTQKNTHSAELLWDTGWTTFHKIGKSDESMLLRPKYKSDVNPEFDASGNEQRAFNPDGKDNYEVALDWFRKGVEKLDSMAVKPKRMGEPAFRSYPAHSQTNLAMANEEEGVFDEKIHVMWLDALQEWKLYANFDYEFGDRSRKVKLEYEPENYAALNEADLLKDSVDEIVKLLAASDGSERTQKIEEIWSKIVQDTTKLLVDFGPSAIGILAPEAADHFKTIRGSFGRISGISAATLAQSSPSYPFRKDVDDFLKAARELGGIVNEELYWSERFGSTYNFRYWKERAVAESDMETIRAREHFYKGEKEYRAANPVGAVAEYEAGLMAWEEIMKKYQRLAEDETGVEDTVKIVRRYLRARDQLEPEQLKDVSNLPEGKIPFKEALDRLTQPQIPQEQMDEMQRFLAQLQKEGVSNEEIQKRMKDKFQFLLPNRSMPGPAENMRSSPAPTGNQAPPKPETPKADAKPNP